jgi:hypothetical protein
VCGGHGGWMAGVWDESARRVESWGPWSSLHPRGGCTYVDNHAVGP